MPIRFRCLACEKLLSSASCLAGKRIICPVCKANVTVPAEEASEPSLPALVAPSELGPEVLSPKTPKRFIREIAWASGVLALLAGLAGALTMAMGGLETPAESSSQAIVKAQSPQTALPETSPDVDESPDAATDPALGLPGSLKQAEFGAPADFGAFDLPFEENQSQRTPVRVLANEPKAVPASAGGAAAAPAPALVAKIVAIPSEKLTPVRVRERWASKRRSQLSDIELRQQLLLPREVDLEAIPGTTKRLISQSPKAAKSGVDLIPQLSATRADLIGLPLLKGNLARMSTEEALNLRVLSGQLRLSIQNSIPGVLDNVVDPRPDHELLRRQLLGSPQQGLWLRPQAISTLRQLLIAEHKNVRLVLVDLLSNIEGRLSSMVLAERAVFDLDADVRVAALVALSNRPVAEYEPALIAGLRYPWPAMADHAAEALVALNLRSAVPKLVKLLDNRDLGEPYPTNVNLTAPSRSSRIGSRQSFAELLALPCLFIVPHRPDSRARAACGAHSAAAYRRRANPDQGMGWRGRRRHSQRQRGHLDIRAPGHHLPETGFLDRPAGGQAWAPLARRSALRLPGPLEAA